MTLSASVAAVGRGFKTFAGDVAEGFFEITHNGLALVGIVVCWRPCSAHGLICAIRASSS